MPEIVPCKLCGEHPVVHSHRAPTSDQVKDGLKPGAWAMIECQSGKHPMVIVKTHRCGSRDAAVAVWNEANG